MMKTKNHLIISGVIFTIILLLWPIFMGISQPLGSDDEQFKWIQNHIVIFKLQFFFAFLLGPTIIYLMVAQLDKYPPNTRITSFIGLTFLTGYLVLNSIAYASQIILIPKLIAAGLLEQAKVWYFGSLTSVTYFIDQMGYCFWGIGAIILFARLIKEKGMIKYLSIIYTVSAILSIIAFWGLILDNYAVNSLTLYSGLTLIPTGIMTTIWGLKLHKTR